MIPSNGKVIVQGGRPIFVHDPILSVPIGKDRNGIDQVLDLACCRNIFIAGDNQKDKYNMLHRIVSSMIKEHGTDEVRFIFASFENSKLRDYSEDPHLVVPIIESQSTALRVLDYLYDEDTRRSQLFRSKKQDWIIGYNEIVTKSEKLPFLIYVMDEIAPMMQSFKADFCRKVQQISVLSRFSGVFPLFATSEINSDVVRENFIKCFPKRIIFRTKDVFQSQLVLGCDGAEKLGSDKLFLLEPTVDKPKKIKYVFNNK